MQAAFFQGLLFAISTCLVGCIAPAANPPPVRVTTATANGSPVDDLGPDRKRLVVRVLALNDFHGHLEPGDLSLRLSRPSVSSLREASPAASAASAPSLPLSPSAPPAALTVPSGGAAWLAGTLSRLRAEVKHSVTVSGGDLVGASPWVSALGEDLPTIEVMNHLGLDLGVVGNHEFDRGLTHLRRLQASARFPMIAANVRDASGKPVFAPSVVREFDGVRVAFVGAVLRQTPELVRPSGIVGLQFLDEAESIAHEVKRLREQGIEAIVAVIHEGGRISGDWNDPLCPGAQGPIFQIVRRLPPQVDLVISGHTHQGYHCVMQGPQHAGLRLVQAVAYGRAVSVIDLAIDRDTGDVDRRATTGHNLPVANGIGASLAALSAHPPEVPDPVIQALVGGFVERSRVLADRRVGWIRESITRAPSPGGDSAMGRLVADAQLAAARFAGAPEPSGVAGAPRAADPGGAQIALMNPGGLRADLSCPQAAAPCAIRMAEAFAVQPFGNTLVTMTLTGEQLLGVLEQQFQGTNATRPRLLQPSSGFGWAWRAQPRGGRHVTQAWLQGMPIQSQGRYRVVVNDFLATGGDGFSGFLDGTDRLGGPPDLEAFITALSSDEPVAAPGPVRLQRLPD